MHFTFISRKILTVRKKDVGHLSHIFWQSGQRILDFYSKVSVKNFFLDFVRKEVNNTELKPEKGWINYDSFFVLVIFKGVTPATGCYVLLPNSFH
jgi:hypothetical protein